MTRAAAALAVATAVAVGAPARADDPGGAGFGVPTGPPWDEARERLVVQLRPASESGEPNAIFRQDVPHTRTALVLAPEVPDGPTQDVTLADALAWNRTGEDLFEIALQNLRRKYPPRVRETPKLRRGVVVSLLYDDRPFAAGHALDLERHERCLGKKGSLVAIPTQYALLCYPIESSRAFHGYLALVNLSAEAVATAKKTIVPHVYWYYEGKWDTQLVFLEEDRFYQERTPEFVQLLKELPRDIHDPRARRW